MPSNVLICATGTVLIIWTLAGYYRSVFYYTYVHSPQPAKYYIGERQLKPTNGIISRLRPNNSMKYLLYYTKFFESEDWYTGFGRKPFIDSQCPVDNCYLTANKSLLSNVNMFDAVLFHIRNINEEAAKFETWHKLVIERDPRQRYVMFTLESPANDEFPYNSFDDFFNWTMTYRLDSDFPSPYGSMDLKNNNKLSDDQSAGFDFRKIGMKDYAIPTNLSDSIEITTSKFQRKKSLVAWMVSNCYTASRREAYVFELQKYIQVDVYGDCINAVSPKNKLLSCPKRLKDECWDMINEKYKFYLAFENSFCDEYITEKFWKIMERSDVVPVVFGGADYSQVAPRKSYIDTRDFSSAKELAEYLIFLDNNEQERLRFLTWKNAFRATPSTNKQVQLKKICSICEALNSPLNKWPEKSYPHIQDWWRGTPDNQLINLYLRKKSEIYLIVLQS